MIDKATIDEIRSRVLLSTVVGERVKLTQRGRSFVGLCPFHKEKTPSFQVNDERGFYHCFGCSASGDVVTFLRETEGLQFREAIETLAARCGVQIVDQRSEGERQQAHAAQRQKDELFEINEAAASYFERCLRDHPLHAAAQAALVDRGIDPNTTDANMQEALREFRLGYAPYGWDGLCEHLRKNGLGLSAAEKVGLLVPRKTGSGYYDRFRHRLMFAVRDIKGRVVAFSGRALPPPSDEQLRALGLQSLGQAQEEPAKYVNSPESATYHKRETLFGLFQAKQALRNQDCCVVVEGNFDVVSLYARGFKNVVAPLGTAFTAEQAREIKRFTANVVLLFDADGAGQRASKSAREPCKQEGLFAKVATLPQGTDPDSLIRDRGREAVEQCVKAARSMLEYLIDSTLDQKFAAADAQARAARIKEVTDLIQSEDDPTIRAMAERHADQIATRLGIADARTFRALRQEVLTAARGAKPSTPQVKVAPPEMARSRSREADIEREMLGALLEFPELLDDPSLASVLAEVEGDVAAAIAGLHRARDNNESPLELLERLPPTLRSLAAERLASPQLTDAAVARDQLLG
ncbi:MAG TPA: DNA primase, partial [Polyangiaceae bacterium]|nr:DNA primase [Polyangiaceae bacterium]